MPRPRFNNLSEERRSRLLEQAANEFATHGYGGASLNGILGALGISKGSFYYYFDDKADLFEAVTGFTRDRLLPRPPASYQFAHLDRESFWPTLERWYDELLARMHELPWLEGLGKLFYSDAPGDLSEITARHMAQASVWLSALLEHGVDLGLVRSDVPKDLLLSMVMGAMQSGDRWFVEKWDDLDEARRAELGATLFGVARRMVAND